MSTRSRIYTKASSEGKYPARSIYCHFDGYIAGVGKTLLNHYTDPEKVNDLMRLGDLSSLGKEIGEKINFNDRIEQDEFGNLLQCKAYTRDRGEDSPAMYGDNWTSSNPANDWVDYIYVFDPETRKWGFTYAEDRNKCGQELQDLERTFKMEEMYTAKVFRSWHELDVKSRNLVSAILVEQYHEDPMRVINAINLPFI